MNSIFLYNLFLSLHIISVIAWMAGLLYLPRLFVYHWSKEVGSDSSETFKLMELRLLKIIMNPANDIFMVVWFSVGYQIWV
jgi:Predicted membrane protein